VASLAGAVGLVVVGGVALMILAGGGEAPTTLATESSAFEREQRDLASLVPGGDKPLRDVVPQAVGEYRLVGAADDGRASDAGASEAFALRYRSATGATVRYEVARFANERHAAAGLASALPDGADGRAWLAGLNVSAARGNPQDVAAFCGGVPPSTRTCCPRSWTRWARQCRAGGSESTPARRRASGAPRRTCSGRPSCFPM